MTCDASYSYSHHPYTHSSHHIRQQHQAHCRLSTSCSQYAHSSHPIHMSSHHTCYADILCRVLACTPHHTSPHVIHTLIRTILTDTAHHMDVITTCFLLLASHPIITSTRITPSHHMSHVFATLPHTHMSSIAPVITSLCDGAMLTHDAISIAVTRMLRWRIM